MTGRGRLSISHLTLILVIVGAAVHGSLSQAAQRMRLSGIALTEGTTLTDRGAPPTLRGSHQFADARKSRTPSGGKIDDGGAPSATIAVKRQSGTAATSMRPDLGRRLSTAARQTHRPRDPPQRI